MVIKKAEDILALLDERIEAMEDLNCQELHTCVKSFMNAAIFLVAMETRKEMFASSMTDDIKKMARHQFIELRDMAWAEIHAIDHLTLRDDAAE